MTGRWCRDRVLGAWVACATAAAAAHATAAHAQDEPEEPAREAPEDEQAQTERARALFQEGIALGDEERWLEAAKRFRAALRLKDAPAVRYNLASALYEAGRWLAAAAALEKVIEHPKADEALRASAEELLADMQDEAAMLTVNVLGAGSGAYVRVDDQVVARAQYGKPLRVSPGSHEVSAEVARQAVRLGSGEEREVDLEWSGSTPAPESSSSPGLAKDWRLWAGVSAGLAVLSIALVAVAASQ